jgi:hypothetical protein
VLLYTEVARANDVMVNVAHDSTYVLGFGHRATSTSSSGCGRPSRSR